MSAKPQVDGLIVMTDLHAKERSGKEELPVAAEASVEASVVTGDVDADDGAPGNVPRFLSAFDLADAIY